MALRHVGFGLGLVVATALIGTPPPAAAQAGLAVTTPFPAVSVQPGASVQFDLTVSADEATRADLSLEGVPDGWTASLSGGGNEIGGVFVDESHPAAVSLNIDVPADAEPGSQELSVVARAGATTARLEVEVTVAESGGGTVTLESDYPSLQGPVDTSFQFNLTLGNDTPAELTFGLDATGPAGWDVAVRPAGETNAASVTVPARGTQRLEVTATAPPDAPASTYPITVTVVAGDQQATTELGVEITGSVAMTLTTRDERLNTTANAGSATDFGVVIINDGTSPLTAVELSGTGPTDWEITFDPPTVEQIASGASIEATAHITPSTNAVAGDYQVTLTARTEAATETIDVRVTVETAPIWGIVGIGLVAATLGGLAWVFRRYGRR